MVVSIFTTAQKARVDEVDTTARIVNHRALVVPSAARRPDVKAASNRLPAVLGSDFPTLQKLCLAILCKHRNALGSVGDVPEEVLRPILPLLSPVLVAQRLVLLVSLVFLRSAALTSLYSTV